MASFATCSTRTKRRKLAAVVDEFRLMLDSAGDKNSESAYASEEYESIQSNVDIDSCAVCDSCIPNKTN
jgi:hypothetical protein